MTNKRTRTNAFYQLQTDPLRRVDKQNSTVHGVIAMQVGEALGHGVFADATTLQLARVLSNAADDGIRGRFGHPGMSENATGKKLMRGRNFRIDGDNLRFDMHMLESARKSPVFGQDPVEYVLAVADLEPTELGMSYVLYTDLVWTFADGSERELTDEELIDHAWGELEPVENAEPPMPVMRPTEIAFIDIVNEGALTSNGDGGFFEMNIAADIFSGRSSEFLVELYDLMDRFRTKYKMPLEQMADKADYILNSYIDSRKRTENMPRKKKAAMSLESVPEVQAMLLEVDDDGPEEAIQEGDDSDHADDAEALPEANNEDDGDALGAIESEMSELMSDISAQPEESPVTLAQFKHLQDSVAQALGTIERQQSEIKRLTSLMQQSLRAVQILHRNQERLSGEPVVTEVVDPNPRLGMEQLAFGHPSPAAQLESGLMVNPTKPREMSPQQSRRDREMKSLERNAARQKMFGTPGGR